jgi:hypothetical protein
MNCLRQLAQDLILHDIFGAVSVSLMAILPVHPFSRSWGFLSDVLTRVFFSPFPQF